MVQRNVDVFALMAVLFLSSCNQSVRPKGISGEAVSEGNQAIIRGKAQDESGFVSNASIKLFVLDIDGSYGRELAADKTNDDGDFRFGFTEPSEDTAVVIDVENGRLIALFESSASVSVKTLRGFTETTLPVDPLSRETGRIILQALRDLAPEHRSRKVAVSFIRIIATKFAGHRGTSAAAIRASARVLIQELVRSVVLAKNGGPQNADGNAATPATQPPSKVNLTLAPAQSSDPMHGMTSTPSPSGAMGYEGMVSPGSLTGLPGMPTGSPSGSYMPMMPGMTPYSFTSPMGPWLGDDIHVTCFGDYRDQDVIDPTSWPSSTSSLSSAQNLFGTAQEKSRLLIAQAPVAATPDVAPNIYVTCSDAARRTLIITEISSVRPTIISRICIPPMAIRTDYTINVLCNTDGTNVTVVAGGGSDNYSPRVANISIRDNSAISHELTHALLPGCTPGNLFAGTPSWMEEGIASTTNMTRFMEFAERPLCTGGNDTPPNPVVNPNLINPIQFALNFNTPGNGFYWYAGALIKFLETFGGFQAVYSFTTALYTNTSYPTLSIERWNRTAVHYNQAALLVMDYTPTEFDTYFRKYVNDAFCQKTMPP